MAVFELFRRRRIAEAPATAVRSQVTIAEFDHDCPGGHGASCTPAAVRAGRPLYQLPDGRVVDAGPEFDALERRHQEGTRP